MAKPTTDRLIDAVTHPTLEWTALASVAVGGIAYDDLADRGVTATAFSSADARATWAVIESRALGERPGGGDPFATGTRTLVANDLRELGHTDAATQLLAADFMRGLRAAEIDELADDLRTWAMRREVAELMRAGASRLAGGATGQEISSWVVQELATIDGPGDAAELVDLGAAVDAQLAAYETSPVTMTTGLSDLDRLLGGGLRPGTMNVLAARPGLGKSALALGIARAVASTGKAAMFVSLEMSTAQLMDRLIAAESRVPMTRLTAGQVPIDDLERVRNARDRIAALPLRIVERPESGMSDIRRLATRVARREDLGLVVIDYLQLLMPESSRDRTRNDEVAAMSRAVKLLSLQLGVPVLALSQLNRGVEYRASKRPGLADLRDSGAVEQDADVVAFLHESEPGCHELSIAKNRQGGHGSVDLSFRADTMTFGQMARGPVVEF